MINSHDILETISMIDNENLDVRTITMGISLLDCIDSDIDKACDKIYDKICRYAKDLVKTGGALFDGSAIVDLYYNTLGECTQFGRRDVTVYVIEEGDNAYVG